MSAIRNSLKITAEFLGMDLVKTIIGINKKAPRKGTKTVSDKN